MKSNLKPVITQFIIMAVIFPWISNAGAMSRSDIYISSDIIPQGELSLIRISAGEGEIPIVTWMKREVFLLSPSGSTHWQGFLVADLNEKPGSYDVRVKTSLSSHEEIFRIEVVDKDYGVRRLTLPKRMVDLDEETLKRVKKESAKLKRIWEAPVSKPAWSGPFLRPVEGKVVGPFGRRSIINEQPRSPHSGVDLRGEEGTPVVVTNNGKVVLTADYFFTGKTVIIDHGGAIMSMYFHLEKILVQEGDIVRKGTTIGLVGSTGRATGPHLHWGVRVNGARINPLRLIAISRGLEE